MPLIVIMKQVYYADIYLHLRGVGPSTAILCHACMHACLQSSINTIPTTPWIQIQPYTYNQPPASQKHYSLCAWIKSRHSTSPSTDFIKQSSLFAFVTGHAQQGLIPSGFNSPTRQHHPRPAMHILFSLSDVFGFFSGDAVDELVNHPNGIAFKGRWLGGDKSRNRETRNSINFADPFRSGFERFNTNFRLKFDLCQKGTWSAGLPLILSHTRQHSDPPKPLLPCSQKPFCKFIRRLGFVSDLQLRMPISAEDQKFLEIAIQEAQEGFDEGGIPIGACLVSKDGKVIAKGRNLRMQK